MKIVIMIGILALVGCNTMNGLGQDMQRAGSNLSDKATPHQERMAYPEDVPPEPY